MSNNGSCTQKQKHHPPRSSRGYGRRREEDRIHAERRGMARFGALCGNMPELRNLDQMAAPPAFQDPGNTAPPPFSILDSVQVHFVSWQY